MPQVLISLSDEDYEQLKGPGRSKKLREMLKASRDHKCPPPPPAKKPKYADDHDCLDVVPARLKGKGKEGTEIKLKGKWYLLRESEKQD